MTDSNLSAPAQDKLDAFIKEYGELVEKHQIDYFAYPIYVPDGNGGFRTLVQQGPIDLTKQPKKSPFVPE